MNKTQLNTLEARIRELVPESMELSFGCRLLQKETMKIVAMTTGESWNGIKDEFHYAHIDGEQRTGCHRYKREPHQNFADAVKDSYEVLGHPITLTWVLKALALCGFEECDMEFSSFKKQLKFINRETGESVDWDWNYSLDKQPPRVIEFLSDILCK